MSSGCPISRSFVVLLLFVQLAACDSTESRQTFETAQRTVEVGFTGRVAQLQAARDAGFDYVELATSEIAEMSEEEFQEAIGEIRRVGIPTPVTNLFVPGSIPLTGLEVNKEQQMEYVVRAFDRLSEIGVEYVVFGSGGARRVPEGFDEDEAFEQLIDFGKRIAPEAQARGMTVLVEPLRSQESNIINSVREGFELVKAIEHPGFQVMIDFYHLAEENESPNIVFEVADHLHHLHMANPNGRVFPQNWEEFEYEPFFENLRSIGYDKRISIEARTDDIDADAPAAIEMMRQAFDQDYPLEGSSSRE